MILLDKTKATQKIVVTITEKNPSPDSSLTLKAINNGSNINYELTLPSNTSPYPSRYDEFIFSTSLIASWQIGTYAYEIKQGNTVLEIGLLHVEDTVVEQFLTVEEEDTDDDFIVYQN